MILKKRQQKWLSLFLSLVLVLGLVLADGITVEAETTSVSEMELNVLTPLIGAKPCVTKSTIIPTEFTDMYEIDTIKWYESDAWYSDWGTFNDAVYNGDITLLPEDATFESGKRYLAYLIVKAKEGYTFNVSSIENEASFEVFAPSSSTNVYACFNYYALSNSLGGGCTYTWEEATGTLSLSGTGSISSSLFQENSMIKKVVVGEGITQVADYTFWYCNSIESVTLPASLTKWGDMSEAFTSDGCLGYDVDSGNTVYQDIDGSLYSKDGKTLYDYVKPAGVSEFTIPESVTTVASFAFDGTTHLDKLVLVGDELSLEQNALFGPTISHIEIKEGVKSLGSKQTVEGLEDTEWSLPASLTSVGTESLLSAESLQKIHVHEDNQTFKDIDGVVVSKDGTKLVCYPAGKEDRIYRTPDSVTTICEDAFYHNNSMKILVLSSGVSTVEKYGFNAARAMTTLTVLNENCTFGYSVNLNCGAWTTVYGKAGSTAETLANSLSALTFYECTHGYTLSEALVKESTCTEKGYKQKYCPACGTMVGPPIELDLKPHTTSKTPAVPATMNADGVKEYYTCSECDHKFLDEAGTTPATAENMRIPKVASVAFSQTDYDLTVTFAMNGPQIIVRDVEGNLLQEDIDYDVTWLGGFLGIREAYIEGIGNYDFEEEITCTIHPSSTLRYPQNDSEWGLGTYTVDLRNKSCSIEGDNKIPFYMIVMYLIDVEKQASVISSKGFTEIYDMDNDGTADIQFQTDVTGMCADGSPYTLTVLPTCSVDENMEFALSEEAKEKLKQDGMYGNKAPFFEKLIFQFVDPCAKGHSYKSEWNMDAMGHWHECSVCGEKETVQPHIAGAPATEMTPQVCTVCGYVIAPAKGVTGGKGTDSSTNSTNVKIPSIGASIKDSAGKALYKVTGTDTENPTVEYTAPVSKTAKSVIIPSTIEKDGITYKVTSVGKNAFGSRKKMTKVTIGSNVETIGDKAFYKCSALTRITIPSKVKKIGKSAFYGCKKLKNVTIKTTKLTDKKVGSKAFKGIHSKATIKVPKTKVKSYTSMLKKKGIGKGVKVKK